MAALGLSETDLAASSFDLVMADRSSPLLSIGQRDIHVRYGDRSAHITIVFCPEIRGMLLCRLDCIDLNILHRQYPKPLGRVQSVSFEAPAANPPIEEISTPSGGMFLRDVYIPLEPSAEQILAIKTAITAEFEAVFNQEEGLRQMVGPDMVIQLRDDAVPFYVNGARPIAFGDRADVKRVLDDLVVKNLRSIIPAHRSSYANEWKEAIAARERKAAADAAVRFRYDARTRPLPPLSIGASVRVQDSDTKLWDRVGVIVAIGRYRSYRIKFASGSVLWRNRRFLRLLVPATSAEEAESTSPGGVEDEAAGGDLDSTIVGQRTLPAPAVYYPDTISILLCSHHFPVLVILRSIVHVMLSASTFLLFSPSFPYDIPCRRAFGINQYRRSGGSGRVVVYSCRSRNESKPTARGAAGWEAGGGIRARALRLERSNLFHVRLVLMFFSSSLQCLLVQYSGDLQIAYRHNRLKVNLVVEESCEVRSSTHESCFHQTWGHD
ncbi:hypothetical protein DAPPUDRAFT_119745 [Daphnia pulex]|uniref:Uncharacterized protein n=1 Tax=Daphnia pulex TaxID=6669 RepID=E9HZC5_DAPPU|nr:hypothetical protein DAPPUDRAFT_119745 [Daphnia pulex]|eukprot:EFX62905.1 hypothetical protein DAPPUDRAFT_119745 [Daphnia pulex]